jgi:beta-phosphoglucomutase-like phosphatase (HAD superfamily)
MLGLPGEVSACLFDMDGVITRTSAAAVLDDALAGVEAGRAGHFPAGVDRVGQAGELSRHGAGTVVRDPAELLDKDDR